MDYIFLPAVFFCCVSRTKDSPQHILYSMWCVCVANDRARESCSRKDIYRLVKKTARRMDGFELEATATNSAGVEETVHRRRLRRRYQWKLSLKILCKHTHTDARALTIVARCAHIYKQIPHDGNLYILYIYHIDIYIPASLNYIASMARILAAPFGDAARVR